MKRSRTVKVIDRRSFLRTVGVGSAATVAGSIGFGTEARAYDPGREETKARYRADAEDVKAFYRTNGYET